MCLEGSPLSLAVRLGCQNLNNTGYSSRVQDFPLFTSMLLIWFYTSAHCVCVLCGCRDAAGKCVGVSASSGATPGGRVGAAVMKVQYPLPSACPPSRVTRRPSPSGTSAQISPWSFIFRCFWFACWRFMTKVVVKNSLLRFWKKIFKITLCCDFLFFFGLRLFIV